MNIYIYTHSYIYVIIYTSQFKVVSNWGHLRSKGKEATYSNEYWKIDHKWPFCPFPKWPLSPLAPGCWGSNADRPVIDTTYETQLFFTFGIVTEIDFFACHLRVTCVSLVCHSRVLKRSLRGLKRSLRGLKRSLRGLRVCVSLACHLRVTLGLNCRHFCSLAIRASGLTIWYPPIF